jgi:hypothetical protein
LTVLDHVTTVRSRELGQTLQRAMESSGRNGSEMASLLGWSPSKMSRLLSGKRLASAVDIAAMLAMCRVVGPRRDEILDLAHNAHEPTWWQDYGTHLPLERTTLTNNMAIATAITTYHDTLVPGLLQTPAYTRALLHALPATPADEVDQRTTQTVQGQLVLDRDRPPILRMFIDEYVLTRTGAGDAVMADQATHLLRLSAKPRVEIRVLPEQDGIGQVTAFTLLELADLPPVVYLEFPTSAAFMEREETIKTYEHVVTALQQRALDEPSSRSWLADIAARRGGRDSPAGR